MSISTTPALGPTEKVNHGMCDVEPGIELVTIWDTVITGSPFVAAPCAPSDFNFLLITTVKKGEREIQIYK